MRTIKTAIVGFAIVINEISPASDPEWVELYASQDSNLQSCTLVLHEGTDSNQKITFADSTPLTANSYFVVKKGERGWNSNWLNNSGDTVNLVCSDGGDMYAYSDVKGKTTGRSPDGVGNFAILSEQSEGLGNAPPTPPPTQKPTDTPRTPSPTSAVLAATASSPPTLKPTQTPTSTPKPQRTAMAITATPFHNPSPVPSAQTESQSSQSVSYGLIGIGIVFAGVGAYPIGKKLYNDKHATDKTIS